MAGVRYGNPKTGWEFFGTELKRLREAAGLTQQQLGSRIFCSAAYIGQFETAIRKPQLYLAEQMDIVLGTDGLLGRLCKKLVESSPYVGYFAEAVYLEGIAVTIREFATMFVPGLLQTAAYARAVCLASRPVAPEEWIENKVAARLDRGRLLDHPTKPAFWAVLDESVLRRVVGGAAVMHEQLRHLVELVQRRRIILQVLPFGAGAPALSGMLTLMTFEDAPPVAYHEGPKTGNLLDDPAAVTHCELTYDHVRAAALSPEASLTLIQSAAEDYAR